MLLWNKKKPIAKGLTVFYLITILLSSLSLAAEGDPYQLEAYTGTSDYKGKIKTIAFTDIGSSPAKDDIVHMAALGVLRATENSKYSPNAGLTRQDAVKYLVRQMGKEGDAPQKTFQAGYLATAVAEGILTQAEATALGTVSATDQTAIDDKVQAAGDVWAADMNLTAADITAKETALRQSLADQYTWGKTITNEEIAPWVARMNKLDPQNGPDISKSYNFGDYKAIAPDKLPFVEAVVDAGLMGPDSQGNFKPKSAITKGQFASLMAKMDDNFLEARGYQYRDGRVDKVDKATNFTDISVDNLEDKAMAQVDIKINEKPLDSNGFVVYKKGKLNNHKGLVKNDYMRYYINKNGQVEYAEVHDYPLTSKRVELMEITPEEMLVKDLATGAKTRYPIDKRVNYFINDIHVFQKDFLEGMEAHIKIRNGKLIEVNGIADEGEPGMVDTGTHFTGGKVLYVKPSTNQLTVKNEEGLEKTFTLKAFVPIFKQGKAVDLAQIKAGDIVRFEFDQTAMKDPTEVYVAAEHKQIQRFIKGRLALYDPQGKKALLENIYEFQDTKWVKNEDNKSFNLDEDVVAYVEGQPIPADKLKNYQGKDVYLATRSDYGDEMAAHFVVKSGYEKKYADDIQDIAYGNQRLKVDYNDITYNDGTIIIKDGRLIDPYSLEKKDSVMVYTYDGNKAAIVAVNNPPLPEGFAFLRGRVDSLKAYSYDMRYFDALENEKWQGYKNERKTLKLSEDTQIMDLRAGIPPTGQAITVDQFTARRNEINPSSKSYVGKMTYAVMDGDTALAVTVVDTNDVAQIVTIGTVKSVDATGKKMTLSGAKDWSPFTQKWRSNTSNLNIDISKATVVKNKKPVALSSLNAGDKLYLLRRNDNGYIVVVE